MKLTARTPLTRESQSALAGGAIPGCQMTSLRRTSATFTSNTALGWRTPIPTCALRRATCWTTQSPTRCVWTTAEDRPGREHAERRSASTCIPHMQACNLLPDERAQAQTVAPVVSCCLQCGAWCSCWCWWSGLTERNANGHICTHDEHRGLLLVRQRQVPSVRMHADQMPATRR